MTSESHIREQASAAKGREAGEGLGSVPPTFHTWGPHGARDSSGAARGLPHGQLLIWEGQRPTRAQGRVSQLGAAITVACHFSGLQDSCTEAGSWFQHSLSAKAHRFFGDASAPGGIARPLLTQLTALHKAATTEEKHQPDMLLCSAAPLNPALHSWQTTATCSA